MCVCVFLQLAFISCCLACIQVINIRQNLSSSERDYTYLYRNRSVSLSLLFATAEISVQSCSEKQISLVTEEEQSSNKSGLWFSILFQKRKKTNIRKQISPFNDYKFHIIDDVPVNCINDVCVEIKTLDRTSIALFLMGILLFSTARSLSRSTIFHYSSGISIGVLMSWMIVLIILYKLLPFKRVLSSVLAVGTAFGFYFLEQLKEQGLNLLLLYPYEVAGYSFTFAVISTGLIYYFGPPSNDRSLNLLQWLLQTFALYTVYQSSYCKEFTVTIIIGLILTQFLSMYAIFTNVVIYIAPTKLVKWYNVYNCPRNRKRLTLEEYEEQGIKETAKALTQLKKYCESPQCNSWNVVSRLQDPKRFSKFLTNNEQFSNEELEAYELLEWSGFSDLQQEGEEANEFHVEHSLLEGGNQQNAGWLSSDETNNSMISADES